MHISSAEYSSGTRSQESPTLQVRELVVGYGDVRIVEGVSLTVEPGQFVAVVGPNGAGKSSLLKGILGVARIFEGHVLLDGIDITGRPLEQLVASGIGYVPQVDDVFDNLRVRENLEMGGYLLTPGRRTERLEELLTIFPRLVSKMSQYVRTMSGGERKMVAVARALMLSPRVLVLDEPSAGLSPALTRIVLEDQVRALANLGTSILIVEQKASITLELADWAYVLVGGRVAKSAPGSVVLRDPDMAQIFLGGKIGSSSL